MNKYDQEIKQRIDSIREKYTSAGDVIFRAAILFLFENGSLNLSDNSFFQRIMQHEGCDFDLSTVEHATLNCARELAQIEILPLLAYIQREIYFGSDGLGYGRLTELLKRSLEVIDEHHDDSYDTLLDLRSVGIRDNEFNELGFAYLLDLEGEE